MAASEPPFFSNARPELGVSRRGIAGVYHYSRRMMLKDFSSPWGTAAEGFSAADTNTRQPKLAKKSGGTCLIAA